MNLEFPSMVDYGLEPSAEVLARAFQDYFVRIPSTIGVLLNMARADSVDLAASCLFLRDGTAVGGALIARRGWTCRLAGMVIVPEARRTGVGRAAVVHLLGEAKARGDRTMLLEVIEQNTAAVELYRACGFREIRRLIGFAGPPVPDVAASPSLIEVDLREVAEAVTRHGHSMANAAGSLKLPSLQKKAGPFLIPPQANEENDILVGAFELALCFSRPGANSIAGICVVQPALLSPADVALANVCRDLGRGPVSRDELSEVVLVVITVVQGLGRPVKSGVEKPAHHRQQQQNDRPENLPGPRISMPDEPKAQDKIQADQPAKREKRLANLRMPERRIDHRELIL
ncbi:MAG: GNAT family N-acetyltransferase [Verrucomicrobiaceae bacterium]|nr:GNAT family N-acetyltransferase [Verrucomicrobiaceae bacterium]